MAMEKFAVTHTADGKKGVVVAVLFDAQQLAVIFIVAVQDGTNAFAAWLMSACTFLGV